MKNVCLLLMTLLYAVTAEHDYFWYNNNTLESKWETPSDVGIYDAALGRTYYVINGASVWEPPAELDWKTLYDANGTPYFRNERLDATTWTRPAALSWQKLDAKKFFYVNSVDDRVTWEKPSEVPHHDPIKKADYWVDKKGKATWAPPSEAAAWVAVKSALHDGREYFSNALTKKSVWELPAISNLAWSKHHTHYDL
jgi:hypothetical protein